MTEKKPGPTQRCSATSKRTHVQCGAIVTGGATVCKWHGGKSPNARAKAAERVTAVAARKLIPDLTDLQPITDPLDKLLELATEADAFRESLRRMANTLDDRIRYESNAGGEQLRAEVATYRTAMRDVTDLLVAIARLDIDKRLARINEQRLDLVLAALSAGIDGAGLTSEQRRAVMTGAGRHLRAVAS